MLDLGFEPHIRAIAGATRADRQTLMFSATWPSEVQKLAMDYMVDPARVVIGSKDLSASHSVTQVPLSLLPCCTRSLHWFYGLACFDFLVVYAVFALP